MRAARTLLSRWAQGAAPTGVRGHPDVSGGRRTAPPRHVVRRLRRRRRALGEPGVQGLPGLCTRCSVSPITAKLSLKSEKVGQQRVVPTVPESAFGMPRCWRPGPAPPSAAWNGRWPARPWGHGGPRAGGNALSFPLTLPREARGGAEGGVGGTACGYQSSTTLNKTPHAQVSTSLAAGRGPGSSRG